MISSGLAFSSIMALTLQQFQLLGRRRPHHWRRGNRRGSGSDRFRLARRQVSRRQHQRAVGSWWNSSLDGMQALPAVDVRSLSNLPWRDFQNHTYNCQLSQVYLRRHISSIPWRRLHHTWPPGSSVRGLGSEGWDERDLWRRVGYSVIPAQAGIQTLSTPIGFPPARE